MSNIQSWSWGNYPHAQHHVKTINWIDNSIPPLEGAHSALPYGNGRSYGDVAINDGGISLATKSLDRFISLDTQEGILRCEAGVLLGDIIPLIIQHGWFLPVTPGTQFVTLGGAMANDVHGKNHHNAGTFGNHVLSFELLRSDNQVYDCSPSNNHELFKATIGGLGLTGLITTVTLRLNKVAGSKMAIENISFRNLDEGLDLFIKHHKSTYSVAWIDCLSTGPELGRGILTLGEHCESDQAYDRGVTKLSIPFYFPGYVLNKWSVKAFNSFYYHYGNYHRGRKKSELEPFFYPLDKILKWNNVYGRNGFYQHQCVIPSSDKEDGRDTVKKLLNAISQSGNASFLAVLKTFGDIESPGLLSFPMPGITLALDIPNKGKKTLALLEQLDEIVMSVGGRIYPAKDARMSSETFTSGFPAWREFSNYIDPQFSSSFWRRVTGNNS